MFLSRGSQTGLRVPLGAKLKLQKLETWNDQMGTISFLKRIFDFQKAEQI